MITEKLTRKVDNFGRVSIPKNLRIKFDMNEGADVEVFTHEINGKYFVCFAPVEKEETVKNDG